MHFINTGREPFFEDVVDHMAAICGAPLAIVVLAESGRQWINGRDGRKGAEVLADERHNVTALLGRRRAVVDETPAPVMLSRSGEARGPTVRAYISVPLVLGGVDVGNLYLADMKLRTWSEFEIGYMDRSGRLVAAHYEARAALAVRDRQIELENRLLEAGALYQAILASMQEGVVVEIEGKGIVASNAAAREILGLTEDQLLGRASIDDRWQATEADGTVMIPSRLPVERAFASGRAQIGVVMGIKRPDGDHRWVRANSMPLATLAGEPRRVATTFADITAELEHDRRLADALKAAEAASAAKSAFLANMSHEIRTPLNGIMGMAQVLSHAQLGAQDLAQVHTILESGRTLMSLLNDVLDLSKIEAGRFDLAPVENSLREVFGRQLDLWQARAAEKNLELTLAIDLDVPDSVEFDATRVQQCASNLISNAIKFTETGSVSIRVSAESMEDGACVITVRVEDTGPGMDEATLARLFRPFTQADETISRSHGGTGLGLSITRRLAELMGGGATANSTPGAGSVFCVSFRAAPVLAGAGKPAMPEFALNPEGGADCRGGLRVLLVDDHPINRQVAMIFLRECADHIVMATNGVEALEALSRETFDIVLLDMHMPVMDGPTAIRRIRASGQPWSRVPVIALTADAMAGDREKYLAMGLDGYLSKPLDERALMSEIFAHTVPHAPPIPLQMAG